MPKIKDIKAREIFDSRGNPTVEVDLTLESLSFGRAAVPSGASTGEHEACELRDADSSRLMGKGVLKAVENTNKTIASSINGKNFDTVEELDNALIDLDGTKNKTKLGANAILGVSMAFARACAAEKKTTLFSYLGEGTTLPVPMLNIINGGKHADNNADIQEFMILPLGAPTFRKSLEMGVETFHSLKKVLKSKGKSTSVGDEGGFAPSLKSNEEGFEVIIEAIEKAGYKPGKDIYLAIDAAASSFFDKGSYHFFKSDGSKKSSTEMVKFYEGLCAKYPIISVEDGLDENDWDGWKELTKALGNKIQIVGDDIFVTNRDFLTRGIEEKSANSILIKLNQIGTVTETIKTVKLAHEGNFTTVISHRSGETEDTIIADFAVGLNAMQIKTGSASRTDRLAKYNQLLRIEEYLGRNAQFAGKDAFRNFLK